MKRFATLRDQILHLQMLLLSKQGAGLHAEKASVLLPLAGKENVLDTVHCHNYLVAAHHCRLRPT